MMKTWPLMTAVVATLGAGHSSSLPASAPGNASVTPGELVIEHPTLINPASVGGPIYWIRNIAYNAPGGSTRLTAGSPGYRLLQQHDPHRDRRQCLCERALAQQPDAAANALPAIFCVTTYVDFLRKNGGASPDCRVK